MIIENPEALPKFGRVLDIRHYNMGEHIPCVCGIEVHFRKPVYVAGQSNREKVAGIVYEKNGKLAIQFFGSSTVSEVIGNTIISGVNNDIEDHYDGILAYLNTLVETN